MLPEVEPYEPMFQKWWDERLLPLLDGAEDV